MGKKLIGNILRGPDLPKDDFGDMSGLPVLHFDVRGVAKRSDLLHSIHRKFFEQVPCQVVKYDLYGNIIALPNKLLVPGIPVLPLYVFSFSLPSDYVTILPIHLRLADQIEVKILPVSTYQVAVGEVTAHEVASPGSTQIYPFDLSHRREIDPHPVFFAVEVGMH